MGALFVGHIVLSLVAIVFERAFWPVCHYPMFSRVMRRGPTVELELALVVRGQERIIEREEGVFLRDFDGVGRRRVIEALSEDRPKLEVFLRAILAARHELGPSAIRLYRVRREYPDADAFRRTVTRRHLLMEVGP